jgi:outer membrane lipoprotein-sorting protein
MTFGAQRFNHFLVILVTFGVIWHGPLFVPEVVISLQAREGAKPAPSNEFTLAQLTTLLSLNPIHQAQFEEVYVSRFLTTPIKKSGRLRYTPPSEFEKHIVTPTEEIFVINEDTVQYENLTQGVTQSLSLQDAPPLQVLITGLRSIFSGDLTTLQQHYIIELDGTRHLWTLTMTPRDEKIQESVLSLCLRGMNQHITEIEIQESNGDHSTLFLQELKEPGT